MTEFIVLHNMSDGRQDRQGKGDHDRRHYEKKIDHIAPYKLSNSVTRTVDAVFVMLLNVKPVDELVAVNV